MTISLPPKGNDAKVLGAYFSPLKVEALATPTMQVKVAEGAFWTADNEHQEFIGGTSPLLSAPGSDAKWVLLTVTPNGALNLVDGTAGTNPELPAVALYKDELPLAAIFVGDTVTAITNDMIYDVRPMWQIPPDSVSQTQLNDFATITQLNNGLATKAETDGTAQANFTLNVGGGSINDSGIYIDRQAGPDVAIRFNELATSGSPAVSNPQWEFTNDGATWNAIGVSEGNYYLKTELNAGALDFLYYQQNQLTGAAGTGVLDSRYYEQADADAAFSALGHTHLAVEITDLNPQVETVNLITPVSGDVSLNIGDMLDVTDTASLDSHLLVWDGVDKYRTRPLNTDDLSDVDTTTSSPVVGDVLVNNGGTFVNRPLLTADISDFTDANYVLITTDQDINGIKTFKDGVAVETILTVADPQIDINFGETGNGVGNGSGTSGIRVDRGFGAGSPGVANNPAIIQWDENAFAWEIGIEGSLATVLTGSHSHTVSDITDFSTGVTAQLNVNNLNQTQDVVYAGLADKDHLSYNIVGQWENQPFGVDVTTELNANDLEELQDVSYVGVVSGEVLIWTGAAWANHLPVKADVSDFVEADYLHTTGDETKTGNLIIDGNFITNVGAGTETRLKSEHTYITDSTVTFNADEAGAGVGGGTGTAGLEIDRGTSDNATLLWNDSTGLWTFTTGSGVAQTTNTIEAVGHTHLIVDVTDITASAAEINFSTGTTSNVQVQLDDKISRTGDAMDAGVNLTFSATGEVLGLPAAPSVDGAAASKKYVDDQITATGGSLTTHAADMTVHLTADQNTLLDGLTLGSPSALSSDDINQLIGISGNVQALLDDKTAILAGPPTSNGNLASWDATGAILNDSGVRVLDSSSGTDILWTSDKIDSAKANVVPGVANNFAKLNGTGQLIDSSIRLFDTGFAVTDIWSANKIDTTKADKILPAANNNLATLDATGNLGDSGVLVNDATNTTAVIWTADKIDTTKADKVVGTLNNFITLDASSELQDSGLVLNDAGVAVTDLWSADKIDTTKMDKAGGSPLVAGNFAEFDGTGNVVDGGSSASTFAATAHTHTASDVTDFTAAADARIAAASIADLADVLITPSPLDLLQWNGAAWVNGTVANIVGTDFVLKSGDTISGDLLISGDLTVNGTTTILDTVNLEVTDKNITLNAGYSGPTTGADRSGLHVNRNDTGGSPPVLDLATLVWNGFTDRWEAGLEGSEQVIAVEGLTVAQPFYEMQQAAEGSPLGSPTTTIAVFTLGFGVPMPAAGATGIQVFVNGVKQIEGAGKAYEVDYTSPSSTVVTFNAGQEPTVAADVEFYGFGYIV